MNGNTGKVQRLVDLVIDELYIERGDIVLLSRSKGLALTLRCFQDELVRLLGTAPRVRYIVLSAPTGSGKTFALLAPALSNVLFGTAYSGVVGVYPTKPLVNDQFISIRDTLDKLGERVQEVTAEAKVNGEARRAEIAIKYRLDVEVVDKRTGTGREARFTAGLVRLTREALDMLQSEMKAASERLALLDLIRRVLLDADYLITVAVPEYPYLMLSSLYRVSPDAQKLLSLTAEGGFVYELAKKIATSRTEEAVDIVRRLRAELQRVLQSKSVERGRLNIYSALFSEVMFLDEFHAWTVYEWPTALALLLLHYLESLVTPNPDRYKVILASATPQEEIYGLLMRLRLGEVKVVKAKVSTSSSSADRVKSRTVVKFALCAIKPASGPEAWFKLEECVPALVEKLAGVIAASRRAIVFGRRNAVVEEAAEAFYRLTGEEPVVVTGVRTRFPGKELLEQRKEAGKLYVFGNYSIELGVDLRRIPFGIVYGVYLGEVVQRLGRIGRGDIDQAEVVIPTPIGYAPNIEEFTRKHAGRASYEELVMLLREVLPERLGVEVYGTKLVMRHKLGKLRIYLPLASYTLTMMGLWEHVEELRNLCRRFVEIADVLSVPDIFPWLRKVSKSADVLVPIASFRVTTSVPYTRDGIEDYASLSSLLGNYDIEYADGKLRIKGVAKKSLRDVLYLKCRSLPSGLFDLALSSSLLMTLIDSKVAPSSKQTVLYKLLKDYSIPVYVAPVSESYELFNAFGYAIRVELAMEDTCFYFLIL